MLKLVRIIAIGLVFVTFMPMVDAATSSKTTTSSAQVSRAHRRALRVKNPVSADRIQETRKMNAGGKIKIIKEQKDAWAKRPAAIKQTGDMKNDIAFLKQLAGNLPKFSHKGETEARLNMTTGIFALISQCPAQKEGAMEILASISNYDSKLDSVGYLEDLYAKLDLKLRSGSCTTIMSNPTKEEMAKVIEHGNTLIAEMKSTAMELALAQANAIFAVSNMYKPLLGKYTDLYTAGGIDVFRLQEQNLLKLEALYNSVPRIYCRADWCK